MTNAPFRGTCAIKCFLRVSHISRSACVSEDTHTAGFRSTEVSDGILVCARALYHRAPQHRVCALGSKRHGKPGRPPCPAMSAWLTRWTLSTIKMCAVWLTRQRRFIGAVKFPRIPSCNTKPPPVSALPTCAVRESTYETWSDSTTMPPWKTCRTRDIGAAIMRLSSDAAACKGLRQVIDGNIWQRPWATVPYCCQYGLPSQSPVVVSRRGYCVVAHHDHPSWSPVVVARRGLPSWSPIMVSRT